MLQIKIEVIILFCIYCNPNFLVEIKDRSAVFIFFFKFFFKSFFNFFWIPFLISYFISFLISLFISFSILQAFVICMAIFDRWQDIVMLLRPDRREGFTAISIVRTVNCGHSRAPSLSTEMAVGKFLFDETNLYYENFEFNNCFLNLSTWHWLSDGRLEFNDGQFILMM